MKERANLDAIVSLAKRRGFIFPSAEIYGGTGSIWDYGPLGVELKRNIKEMWWQRFVRTQPSVVGVDTAIVTRREVLVASGHEGGFSDPLVECKDCHERFRHDHILEGKYGQPKQNEAGAYICPNCGGVLTDPKQFNLMFKTYVGPVETDASVAYLRPETAQGIFTNFKNVAETSRLKLPFGIGQAGKAFRNEITPGNFIFRTREFEQCELEWFVAPDAMIERRNVAKEGQERTAHEWYDYWIQQAMQFYLDLGIAKERLRFREHDKDELSHYAKGATDVEYEFPFGWSELMGIAHRGNFDLSQHQQHSGKDLTYFDDLLSERYIPEVIEPSLGVERTLLTVLIDAYEEVKEKQENGRSAGEIVLHLHPALAPVKVAVLPLTNKEGIPDMAQKVYADVAANWNVQYDATGSIGRRYRRQDEIGTPFCVTVDFDSLKDKQVTVRDRDSLKQERVAIADLLTYFSERLQ